MINKIFHPGDLPDSDQWSLAHVALGVKKYNDLGQPRGFSKDIAPDWYQNLNENQLEQYWDLQEKYLQDCLAWIDGLGVNEAYIQGVDEDREKDLLSKTNVVDGEFKWSSKLVEIVPTLNFQNLYLKANDGSELIIFESDTETVFIHDASNSLPDRLKSPLKV